MSQRAIEQARARWGQAAAIDGGGADPTAPATSRLRDASQPAAGQDLSALVTASGGVPTGYISCGFSPTGFQLGRWPRPGEPGYVKSDPAADAQRFLEAMLGEPDPPLWARSYSIQFGYPPSDPPSAS